MERLGNYELLGRVAMGGMAEIFRARQKSEAGFEKDVIIKRILPHYTDDPEFLRMFQDEAVVAAKLNHPNIVQVFDFKSQDGVFYIAMELVEGVDLRRLMSFGQKAEKPLGPNRAVQIALAMTRGLGHAHERVVDGLALKIVHRDVSPHNVLVSIGGDVKVMDFGIAKAAARATKTGTGVVKGKLAYMSPEQAAGLELDHRTDIYATGIVLWEMLSGRRLFSGDNEMETLRLVQTGVVPPIESLVPDLKPELAAIVAKFLAKDKEQRYQRMREAERELSSVLHLLGGPDRAPLDDYFQDVVPEETREALRGTISEGTRDLKPGTKPMESATKPLVAADPTAMLEDAFEDANPTRSDSRSKATTLQVQKKPTSRVWIAAPVLAAAALAVWIALKPAPVVKVDLNQAQPQPVVVAPEPTPTPPPPVEVMPAPAPAPEKPKPVEKVKPAPPPPKLVRDASLGLTNCPAGGTVYAGKIALGTISRSGEVFAIPSGTQSISVKNAAGKVIGRGDVSLRPKEVDTDSFSCK